MSYHELAALGVTFRPIDRWPGDRTGSRRDSTFSARFSATVSLLARELHALNAARIVVQVALGESDIRLDGFPRADRRASHPGVVLAFDSKHGPLKFAVDTFWTWQDNLRAIALGMEALRKVDRYGVTRRGEQYTGWRAIPERVSEPADLIQTEADARKFLSEYGGSFTAAALRLHPDRGGDPALFRAAVRAREIVEEAAA